MVLPPIHSRYDSIPNQRRTDAHFFTILFVTRTVPISWNRIPKEVQTPLECPDEEPFKVGWGLYFIEEFSHLYLLLVLMQVGESRKVY